MSDEESEITAGDDVSQDNSQLDGTEDSQLLTDDEISNIQSDEPQTKKKKSSGKNSGKKSKKGKPESIDDVCEEYNMENPTIEYTEDDYLELTSYRHYQTRYREKIECFNPESDNSKQVAMVLAKYKEFKQQQNEFNANKANNTSGRKNNRSAGSKEKSVPAIKIKIAGKKRGKKQESDDEFEELLKQHETELDAVEKEKEERRIARAQKIAEKKAQQAAEANKFRKPKLDNIEHKDYCESCGQGGEILLCDYCPRTYHLPCVDPNLTEAPEGDWMCPGCEEECAFEERVSNNKQYCYVCKEGENLLYCTTCTYSFHGYCHDPPLTEVPVGDYVCPRCTCEEPKNKIDKILSWKWDEKEYPEPWKEDELPPVDTADPTLKKKRRDMLCIRPAKKLGLRRVRMLYIKWKYLSHWHCDWLPEMAVEIHHAQTWRTYFRKNDPEVPPNYENDEDGDEERAHRKNKAHDPLDLYDRFYKYGVKPNWLVVQRIINHINYGKNQYDYLVKWSELSYNESTWERDDFDIPGYETAICKYWQHRHDMTGDTIPKAIKKKIEAKKIEDGITEDDSKKKKVVYDIKKKHEVQPDYITETGGTLHPYQLEGINWLRHCYSQGTHAILADEMGLGKTVQAMTFLYSLYKENASKGPFLVAAPLSTLLNWEREAHIWCKDFYCVTYAGDKDSRAVIREHEFSFAEGAVKGGPKATKMKDPQSVKFHVLLTSYELINMDKAILSSIKWGALVVDEAHRLKNNQSLFFRNLREYDIEYRLLLTGTPLQNNLEELFHLLNFLCPDSFYDLENFTSEFADVSKEDQIQKLHSMLGPHMLRRLKADVLTGMPTKSELIVPIDLAPMQRKWYKNILTKNFEALNVKNGGTAMSLTNVLMELKKCCNHPYLFAKASIEAPKAPNGLYEINALVKASGKLVVMQKMLRKLFNQGHRVLIFSQMTRMLDVLEDFCEAEGYKFERIDGSITGQLRQEAIDRFNAPGAKQFIFLLSTRAGGLGINLATADTVIIYDSDWNPHNDTQAFSRAHRLGQKNTVLVYRFVTRNSVEEKVTSVAKKKMLLNHLVVRANTANKGPSLSKTELDDVIRWGTEELFKDDDNTDENGDPKPTENAIVWDDEAIDKLLERKPFDPNEKVDKDWSDEYLSTFKVATYATKEVEEEEEPEVIKQDDHEPDPDYWEKLLRHHYEQDQESELQNLGKGKRLRKQVNYAANGPTQEWQQVTIENEGEFSEDFSDVDDQSEGGDSDADGIAEARKRKRYGDDKLPPLLSKVNGQMEVLGFNPRQRKAFYNAIMRWGMPPSDAYQSQWLTRDLKSKSERVFKAYSSLFMRHLCEPVTENAEYFSDGVPKEGISRHHILARMGIMCLIRRKVQEFESFNGEWSMPEVKEKMEKEAAEAVEKAEAEAIGGENMIYNDEESQTKDKSVSPNNDDVDMADASNDGTTDPKNEIMEVESNENTTDNIMESNRPKTLINGIKKPRLPFKFNIADGGFTELHGLWQNEEAQVTPGTEYEVWHRRHDFWLLNGITIHGYGRMGDIMNDPRFSILNEPFETLAKDKPNMNSQDVKSKFLQRRYKLLEQALIIEEQLRRAAFLNIEQPDEDGLKNLDNHHAEFETLVAAHQDLNDKAKAGDRNSKTLMTKVIGRLEDLLNDMKNDIARIPATVAKLSSVAERLHMTEREILSRLTTKDENVGATKSPLPPPGPFITPEQGQKLSCIQPKFVYLFKDVVNISSGKKDNDNDIKKDDTIEKDIENEENGKKSENEVPMEIGEKETSVKREQVEEVITKNGVKEDDNVTMINNINDDEPFEAMDTSTTDEKVEKESLDSVAAL
uniref:DNA helicase n=1 Tax=Parastrongyloides trichosuri TaxID=131310 RepID=A0A0N4ZGI1_PARTI